MPVVFQVYLGKEKIEPLSSTRNIAPGKLFSVCTKGIVYSSVVDFSLLHW